MKYIFVLRSDIISKVEVWRIYKKINYSIWVYVWKTDIYIYISLDIFLFTDSSSPLERYDQFQQLKMKVEPNEAIVVNRNNTALSADRRIPL